MNLIWFIIHQVLHIAGCYSVWKIVSFDWKLHNFPLNCWRHLAHNYCFQCFKTERLANEKGHETWWKSKTTTKQTLWRNCSLTQAVMNHFIFHWSPWLNSKSILTRKVILFITILNMLYEPFSCSAWHIHLLTLPNISFEPFPDGFLIRVHLVCPFWSNSHIDPIIRNSRLTFKRTPSNGLYFIMDRIFKRILFPFLRISWTDRNYLFKLWWNVRSSHSDTKQKNGEATYAKVNQCHFIIVFACMNTHANFYLYQQFLLLIKLHPHWHRSAFSLKLTSCCQGYGSTHS